MFILDDAGIEKQLKRRDGVVSLDANVLSGTATIVYDETRVTLNDITVSIAEFGISKELLGFLLVTPAVFYGGWVFYVGAWRAIKNRVANMAVLVSLSVLAGYFFSVGATFFFTAEVFLCC